jgi:hypothetical protein
MTEYKTLSTFISTIVNSGELSFGIISINPATSPINITIKKSRQKEISHNPAIISAKISFFFSRNKDKKQGLNNTNQEDYVLN